MNPPTADSRLLFAGIDGGGTTTRALIGTSDGAIFGCGYAEGCNPSQLGADLACERLRTAMNAAWENAGLSPQPLAAAFCGVAGLRAYAAQNPVDPLWISVFPGTPLSQISWDHDLRPALAGGLLGQPGIVLIAGTGSACYGRDSSGLTTQVGGWGSLLDDVGSGYALGLGLLKHAIQAWESRTPASSAAQQLSAQTGLRTPEETLRWTKSFADPRPQIARLASLVLQAWREHDALATGWVNEAANELAALVATAARRLFSNQAVSAVFTGGMSQNSEYFEKVREAVACQVTVDVRRPQLSATAGALLLALQTRNESPSEGLLKKLRNLSAAQDVEST